MDRAKICVGLAMLLSLSGATVGFAEQSEAAPAGEETSLDGTAQAGAVKEPMAPVTIEGDDISFNNLTGEVYAKGNVIITQERTTLTGDDIQGNTKSADVWLNGAAHVYQPYQPFLDLDAYDGFYNYNTRTGTLDHIKGKVDERFVEGQQIEFYPEEVIIYNGTMTKCPAKRPDYHMSASKIEIWPDDRMVAYDAKIWLRDTVIYSTKRYETKIGKNAKDSTFPRIGYNSDNGVYVKQNFQYHIGDDIMASANIGYFTKHDFKNEYSVFKTMRNYRFTVEAGDFQDDDDNWIKKEPEFHLEFFSRPIGKSHINYTIDAIVGKRSDDRLSSWHQEYEIYFQREPIKLTDSLTFNIGMGYEHIRESYNKLTLSSFKQDYVLYNSFSPKMTAWTGYHYTKNNSQDALFNYGNADVSQELASGMFYRFDDKNAVSVAHSYDLANSSTVDMDYTWHRDLHCWQLRLTYREKRDQFKIEADITNW